MHGIIGKILAATVMVMMMQLELIFFALPAMAKDLLEMQLSKDAFESARVISDCADHLLGLVNDILDFARIESQYALIACHAACDSHCTYSSLSIDAVAVKQPTSAGIDSPVCP
jgi:signal transduction histidine kinase